MNTRLLLALRLMNVDGLKVRKLAFGRILGTESY
jgi:hypothetical protein